ncbi:MAG: hypothetical protein ACRBBK_12535 [Paracoccaceae bacterium]
MRISEMQFGQILLRILACAVIISLSVLAIHSEYLIGKIGGASTIYAPSLLTRILAIGLLCLAVFLPFRTWLSKLVIVVGLLLFWALQFQSISTESSSEPPNVSVSLFGIFEIDQAAHCIASSADDVFVQGDQSVTSSLSRLDLMNMLCDAKVSLLYVRIPYLIEFEKIETNGSHRNISDAIDRILGIS